MKKNYPKSILAFIVALLPWWLVVYGIYSLATTPVLPDLPKDMQEPANIIVSMFVNIIIIVIFTAVMAGIYLFILTTYFADVEDTEAPSLTSESNTSLIITLSIYSIAVLITAYQGYRLEINSPDVYNIFTQRYWAWMMIAINLPTLLYIVPDKLSALIWYLVSKKT